MLKKFSTTASGAYVLLLWCAYWNTSYIYHTNTAKLHKLFLYHLDGSSFTTLQSSYSMAIYTYLSIYNLVCYYSYHVNFDLF